MARSDQNGVVGRIKHLPRAELVSVINRFDSTTLEKSSYIFTYLATTYIHIYFTINFTNPKQNGAYINFSNKFHHLFEEVLEGNVESLESYKASAERFLCTLIPETSSSHIEYTPGGSNLQHATTTISFLELVYANYLHLARHKQSIVVTSMLVHKHFAAKKQVDYILGDNPVGLSYMVGYGNNYPQRIHHRGSSLPSIKDHPQFIACKEGSIYFNSTNPNVLVGAIVGGPGEDDVHVYVDDRAYFRKSEPTTYINAPFVGVLAYFVANPNP